MAIRPGKEEGREGLEAFYGRLGETYTDELRWPHCYNTYNEMRRRDPTLRAILNAIRLLARQSEIKAEAPTDKAPDVEAAEFLQGCIEDMSHTVTDFVDDYLTCLPFGWSSFEIVYKRRAGAAGKSDSKFDDGKIGWRKMAFRRQSTLDRWEFDKNGGLQGWHQQTPPYYDTVFLPIEKLLHFTAERDGTNPEGISLFESAYEPWHFVTNLQIIGGIGWQRSFVGLPVFEAEETIVAEDKAAMERVGQALTVDSKQFVIAPNGIKFKLETVPNDSAMGLLSWLRHFRTMMAQLVLADFIFLGMGETGSYALGQDKSVLFLMAVNAFLDRFCQVWSRHGVKRLFGYNEFPGITELPRITHTEVRKPNLPELGEFLQRIAPLITLGDEDELAIRNQSGFLPEMDLEELQRRREEKEANVPPAPPQPPGPAEQTGETEDESDDDENLSEFAEPELTEEEKARRRVEASFARDVRSFLRGQQERLVDELTWADLVWDDMSPDFWKQEQETFKAQFLGDFTKYVTRLMGIAAANLTIQVGTDVDWTLANIDAADWARKHTAETIRMVTSTTKKAAERAVRNWTEAQRQQVAREVERFVRTGEDLPELVKRLEPVFGKQRAEMIATTETTRAYGKANDLLRQQAGLPATVFQEPAHVRCRCGTRSELLPSGEWVVVWQTAFDEKVCKQPLDMPWGAMVLGCSALQGMIVSEGPYLGQYLSGVS